MFTAPCLAAGSSGGCLFGTALSLGVTLTVSVNSSVLFEGFGYGKAFLLSELAIGSGNGVSSGSAGDVDDMGVVFHGVNDGG